MKDTFLSARLVAPDLIRLVVFSTLPYEKMEYRLVSDRVHDLKLAPSKIISTSSTLIVDFHLAAPLELGHSYVLAIPSYGIVPLDVNEATTFPDFDAAYLYEGSDLGSTYAPGAVSFAVWAPLASSLLLKIKKKGQVDFALLPMTRSEQGVYRLTLEGDYLGAEYSYFVTNSEITVEATDPYAKASTPNGGASVVEDFGALKKDFRRERLPVLNSYTDAIIYEGSVRDLTIDKHTDIVQKGTYKGLSEKGRKTMGGNPAGFDYLVSLGITHLQLLPICDFKTVDELHPDLSYNWGYDPAQYFVPEGSYASNVSDPLSRIEDLQALVASFHEAGVRIVMDVVFNHVYDYVSSVFEKLVPNYWFRRARSGRMANTSFCGDDLASERPMVHKLIVAAAEWWIDFYGIDGFRFDLMGILDVKTLEEISAYGKARDPSFMVYGEGWDMGEEVNVPLGTMENCRLLPDFAFFNDAYRDFAKRYLTGDASAQDLFKYAYVSSSFDYGTQKARFLNANQTLNYVECHDNATFFDFVDATRPLLSLEDKLDLCKLAVASVLVSFGIPFIHAGEEIGQSKFGKDNTYNLSDLYNHFSYRLLDERKEMYDYFVSLVRFRKEHKFLHAYDRRVIAPLLDVTDMGHGFMVRLTDINQIAPYQEVDFFFNPTDEPIPYAFSSDREILLDSAGQVSQAHTMVQNALVPKHSLFATCLP
jgi:pullulanase